MYHERIRDTYDRLSPAYRKVADYLLGNYREAAFMTAAELAHTAGVDTTTVVRFAQRLGYPGYPELIGEIQEEVKSDLRKVYAPPPGENNAPAAFARALTEDHNNLEYMMLHLDRDLVQIAVDLLLQARRVFVVSEGSAIYLGMSFAMRLTALGLNAWAMPGDSGARAALSVSLAPNDVVIGLCQHRQSPGVAVVLQVAREEHAHTIAITAAHSCLAGGLAEYVLYAPGLSTGIMPSMTATAGVINGLVQALTVQMGEQAADWALRAEHLIQRFRAAGMQQIGPLLDLMIEHNPRANLAQDQRRAEDS